MQSPRRRPKDFSPLELAFQERKFIPRSFRSSKSSVFLEQIAAASLILQAMA